MTALLAGLAAAAVLTGILLVVTGLRPVPETELVARPHPGLKNLPVTFPQNQHR